MRLTKAQSIRRSAIATKVLRESLRIGTSGPLLGCTRSQASATALGSEAALTTLVALLLSGHGLTISHHIAGATSLHRLMVLVHLVVESCRSDRSASLENTQLLLV